MSTAQVATIQTLCALGIRNYTAQADGTVMVNGDINLEGKNLTFLPDLSNVHVRGDFKCNNNKLTSLAGSPLSVSGEFVCYCNELTTLKGASRSVGGSVNCAVNALTTLEGAPENVGKGFYCFENRLVSLAGAPRTLGDDFNCSKNALTTLAGGPESISAGAYHCEENQLTSLEGMPASAPKGLYCRKNALETLEGAAQDSAVIVSDFGTFDGWNSVPAMLKLSDATLARIADEALRAEIKTSAPVVLKSLSIGGIKRK